MRAQIKHKAARQHPPKRVSTLTSLNQEKLRGSVGRGGQSAIGKRNGEGYKICALVIELDIHARKQCQAWHTTNQAKVTAQLVAGFFTLAAVVLRGGAVGLVSGVLHLGVRKLLLVLGMRVLLFN